MTEGEDKPLKYPHMFRAADIVILNKIDLLPHIDFDVARALAALHQVNPDSPVLHLSARTGQGMSDWTSWIGHQAAAARQLELT